MAGQHKFYLLVNFRLKVLEDFPVWPFPLTIFVSLRNFSSEELENGSEKSLLDRSKNIYKLVPKPKSSTNAHKRQDRFFQSWTMPWKKSTKL